MNCTQNDIDDLKELTKDLNDIQCYTDFSSEEFECKKNILLFHICISFFHRRTKGQ